MAIDTGIVTIYDLENDGAPLTAHRTDAREFLAHPSGRWSTSPDAKKPALADAKGKAQADDSGEAMRLKAMSNKALKAMAEKALIPGADRMKKADLVDALLAIGE